jgi:hypothetical protein
MAWLESILSGETREIAVEASYYVARVLKQLMIRAELRKEPLADAEASLPSAEARSVGTRILDEIKTREGLEQLELSKERASYYLELVLHSAQEKAKNHNRSPAESAQLLAELRSNADSRSSRR